jgi:hypothetical protein
MARWKTAHIRAFAYLGMAVNYDVAVNPARARRPQDKAQADG